MDLGQVRCSNEVESTLERTAMSIGYPKTREFIGDVDQLREIISSSLISASGKKAFRSWARYVRTKSQRSSNKVAPN